MFARLLQLNVVNERIEDAVLGAFIPVDLVDLQILCWKLVKDWPFLRSTLRWIGMILP